MGWAGEEEQTLELTRDGLQEERRVCFRRSFHTVADKGQTQYSWLKRLSWRKQPEVWKRRKFTNASQNTVHKEDHGAKEKTRTRTSWCEIHCNKSHVSMLTRTLPLLFDRPISQPSSPWSCSPQSALCLFGALLSWFFVCMYSLVYAFAPRSSFFSPCSDLCLRICIVSTCFRSPRRRIRQLPRVWPWPATVLSGLVNQTYPVDIVQQRGVAGGVAFRRRHGDGLQQQTQGDGHAPVQQAEQQ